jgi:hypothetical protein
VPNASQQSNEPSDLVVERTLTARAVDLDVEISADHLADLRDRLAEELNPFGYMATLVGIRGDPEIPTA